MPIKMKHSIIHTKKYMIVKDDLENIIAHLPRKKNTPILDGVDLLPKLPLIDNPDKIWFTAVELFELPIVTGFDCETENIIALDGHTIIGTKPKTILNSQCQNEWKGTYIYQQGNDEMKIKKQQQDIVDAIEKELTNKHKYHKPSYYRHSVWFQPLSGRFLFDDTYIRYEVIEPLIENNKLVFKGVENHQGEKMLRYVLSYGCLFTNENKKK